MKIVVKNISKTNDDFNLKDKFRLFFAKEFFRNPIIQWLFIATIFINLVAWTLLAIFIRPSADPIWLHYNVYFGVDIIGSWWQAYILPVMGLFFFFVNFVLGYYFFNTKERIATHILFLASLLVQVSIIVAVVPIIIINSALY
jgi:hypothetical protein